MLIPEEIIPIPVGSPRLGNTAITEYINVSEAQEVYIVCFITAAAATATPCVPLKAYAAAGTGSTAITTAVPIYAGVATAGAALTLTRQTDAVSYTTAATAGVHVVIFKIDPSTLGWEATVPSLGEYKYLSCTVTGLVADYVSCYFFVVPRYKNDTIATTRWIV